MKKYFGVLNKDKSKILSVGSSSNLVMSSSPSISNIHINVDDLPADPGLRKNIFEYDVNNIENVRRAYFQKGPYQPRNHDFPMAQSGAGKRRFISGWFDEFNWLEYSIAKDAAFCLPCYLFKPNRGNQGGGDAFVRECFRAWKKKEIIGKHVGDHNSSHNKCVRACEDLMHHRQHIDVCLSNYSDQSQADYRVRLTASIDCLRFLLQQGMAFRGHDESAESSNQGNFLELLQFLADHNDEIKRVSLDNAPGNLKLTSPKIQRDIISAIAVETTNSIIRDVGDELFAILVDEARDISVKEQMAVVLRFVDERGFVVERLLGIQHVNDTTALSLKMNIDALLCQHGLSISSIRGQGYDGASNMQGEFNGLKTLIMNENPFAYYVHCFAHQLQLALVAVAEKHSTVCKFFDVVSMVTNVVGASCKRKDMLREKAYEKFIKGLTDGDLSSGTGLNQQVSLNRAGATRWSSHYKTLTSLKCLFDSSIEVLIVIANDSRISRQRTQADYILRDLQCFEFILCLFLMTNVLGISHSLSQALQRKDQDIVNAMNLVKLTKNLLQQMRDEGWELLLAEVIEFCIKREITVPNMEDLVIDMQLQELRNRFDEVGTELLLCMSCLDPSESFLSFDKSRLIRFAEFYPNDFSYYDLMTLGHQLDCYIMDVRSSDYFSNLLGISELSRKLVQSKKHRVYPLVYLLLKLALILPVATTTVERVFSAMKLVKSALRNRLGDDILNDCLISYIEKDVMKSIDIENIIVRFQNMTHRKMSL